ncbi:MAG: carbonic anhydrase [Dermatophilaceae bacterium]
MSPGLGLPPRGETPSQAWAELAEGNDRFVHGIREHPNQDVEARASLTAGQTPRAVFFGCADSRVAAEIIFDQGLGDLFVVRTAGHVVDSSVLGSIEFGVGVLDIPLVVVLGHDSCGAVRATLDAVSTGDMPTGFLRDIVERVTPSVLSARKHGASTTDDVEAEHVRHTARLLADRSSLVGDRVQAGTLGIVGATYGLREGRAMVVTALGLRLG